MSRRYMYKILIILLMVILLTAVSADDVMKKLSSNDWDPMDRFGYKVSTDGQTAIITSIADDSWTGSAYVFEKQSDGNWSEVQTLKASDATINEAFGSSVSIYNDLIIIGAPFDSHNGLQSAGSAYIFQKQPNGLYTQMQKLTASNPANDGYFGHAIGIYEEVAVIGSPWPQNKVWIFNRTSHDYWNNQQWIQSQILTPSDPDEWAEFGHVVDIYNNTIIVGAYGINQTYIFKRDENGIWNESEILRPASLSPSPSFGRAVSIYKDIAIVGSPFDVISGSEAGAAYVFTETSDSGWQKDAILYANDARRGDSFGCSVSIYNGTVAIGAYEDSNKGVVIVGAVYLFQRNSNGSWIQRSKIMAFDGTPYAYFGHSVSIYGDHMLVGAEGDNGYVGAGYMVKNWNSCNQIWTEYLVNTTNRYLINWEWTNCTFTAALSQSPTTVSTTQPTVNPASNPTANPSKVPTADPTIQPSLNPMVEPLTAIPTYNPTSNPTAYLTTDVAVDNARNIYVSIMSALFILVIALLLY